MKNQVKILFCILLFCVPLLVKSQDIHFSQFYFSPLNLNPAEVGNFEGDYRLVGNNKNQWMSFEQAYRTFSLSVDRSFFKSSDIKLGTGLLLNKDIAGDGHFGTFRLSVPIAGIYKFNNSYISLSIAPALVQHGINMDKLNFGSQYENGSFNPDLSSGELFKNNRFSYFDVSAGALYKYNINPKHRFKIGAMARHIFRPSKSFNQEKEITLNVEWLSYIKYQYKISQRIEISPSILFMTQGPYKQYHFGIDGDYYLQALGLQKLHMGVYLRAKDAGILYMGFTYNDMSLRLSYDINISSLYSISKGRGGLELSLIYILKRKSVIQIPIEKKCPDFM